MPNAISQAALNLRVYRMKLRYALQMSANASVSQGSTGGSAPGERLRKLSSESNLSGISNVSESSIRDVGSEIRQRTEAALEQVDHALLRLERSILVFSEFGHPGDHL